MAISPYKTFSPGEILTAADLNALQSHITSNGEDLGWPATKAKDFDGQALTLDSDGDTQLQATADDVLTLKMQGVNLFVFDGDVASPVNGLTFTASDTGNAVDIAATGTDTNIDLQLSPKGTGVVRFDGPLGPVQLTKGADVASANALPVDVDGNIFDVTGTTTIQTLNTKGIGTPVILQFDSALTIEHHATDLILPNGEDIAAQAGDHALLYEYATGDWRMAAFFSAISRLKPVAEGNASAAASIDIEGSNLFTSKAKAWAIQLRNLGPAAADNVYFRVKVGGSYVTANYAFHTTLGQSSATTYNAASSSALTTAAMVFSVNHGLGTNDRGHCWAIIENPAATGALKRVSWFGGYGQSSGAVALQSFGSGVYHGGTGAVTGFQVLGATSNIAGDWAVYALT